VKDVMFDFFSFFSDPVLRGPTIGCILMAAATAMIGSITFVRQRSLIGESLAHASYPGVIISVFIAAAFMGHIEEGAVLNLMILLGACVTSLLGYWAIDFLEHRLHIASDSALCLVLSGFFGLGVTVASQMQFTHPVFYQRVQVYFYGQAATMGDSDIFLYALLVLLIALVVFFFFKQIQSCCFDRNFSKSIGIPVRFIDRVLLFLVAMAIIISIRSVGFVLVSAMLISPPIAARCFTVRFGKLFFISACFGAISGFLGNYLSVMLSLLFPTDEGRPLSLPTGPMIVLVAATLGLFALLFTPNRGVMFRSLRLFRLKERCLKETVLTFLWQNSENSSEEVKILHKKLGVHSWRLRRVLRSLRKEGFVTLLSHYVLTEEGKRLAADIVRLHELWNLYVIEYPGGGADRLYRSADEMKLILTPEVELYLTKYRKSRLKSVQVVEPNCVGGHV
jgi:manganese/zinc/iron transport system permease protein